MIQIIPAIIPSKFEEIQEKMDLINGLPKNLVSKVQIDVVDGKYAGVTTWPFNVSDIKNEFKKQFLKTDNLNNALVVEVDMMVEKPEDYIQDFITMGAKSFVVHVDSTHYIDKCLHVAREAGCEVGLGIKPSVDSEILEEYLDRVDFVQFMGNDNIGHNGVELDRRVLDKIYHFHSGHPYAVIQVDIGVNIKTAPEFKRVSVSGLVSGSAVFGNTEGPERSRRVAENIKKLNSI